MTLLTIIQDVADRVGLVRPTTVVGSTNEQARQLLAFANIEGRSLAMRHDWEFLRKERTFTTTGGSSSFEIPTDFARIVPRSFWNRTQDRQVVGPLTAQRWQEIQAKDVTAAALDSYYIRGGAMLMYPTPVDGDTYYYEYVTRRWCTIAAGTAPTLEAWNADTNIHFFDDELFTMGVAWRYKRSRGLDFADDQVEYELRLASAISHDGGLTDLDMGNEGDGVLTDPSLSEGSWNL